MTRGKRHPQAGKFTVQDRGYKTPCHIWSGTISSEGYALLSKRYVHRIVCEADGGVPDGMEPDHLCRQRPCIRRDHLEVVTRKVNARRGAKAKLSFDDVDRIRELLAEGKESQRAIAAHFGVSPPRISQINTGKAWA